MTIRESFEARGERKGKIEGKIELLLEDGKTDAEIVRYLATMRNNTLTREEAEEALRNYYAATAN